MLNDNAMASELHNAAGENAGVFADLLLVAVLERPASRLQFELFTLHRYYKRIYLGQILPVAMGGFVREEQEAIAFLQENTREFLNDDFRRRLGAANFQLFGEIISDFFYDAFYEMKQTVKKLQKELTELEFEWLDLIHRNIGKSTDEQIRGYRDILDRYEQLKAWFQSLYDGMQVVISIMYGRTAINIEDLAMLRNVVGENLGIPVKKRKKLGRTMKERIGWRQRCATSLGGNLPGEQLPPDDPPTSP